MTGGTALERQIEKYVAEVARVEQRIQIQIKERVWQKWWIVGGAVLGVVLYFLVKPWMGLAGVALGFYLFATGIYLTTIHLYEARGQLLLVKSELNKLRAKEDPEKVPAASAGSVPTAKLQGPLGEQVPPRRSA